MLYLEEIKHLKLGTLNIGIKIVQNVKRFKTNINNHRKNVELKLYIIFIIKTKFKSRMWPLKFNERYWEVA